jgi:N-acetylmuramoyl-L-alanine amidase
MSKRPIPDSPYAAKVFASPNHGERKDGKTVDSLILHYTGMGTAAAALQWLCNPLSEVSCHYFLFEDGQCLQLVPEERRAWHAGAGSWQGECDINSVSIGIEIVNPGHEGGSPDFPAAQIEALIALGSDIVQRWRIPPPRLLAHSDIAPGRKADPGENFPWDRLSANGLGHWVAPEPVAGGRFFAQGDEGAPVEALQGLLALYGYGLNITGQFDAATEKVVRAFQRHFRPERVDGIADGSTIRTLHKLVKALPDRAAP